MVLEELGYKIVTACHGRDALEQFTPVRFDLVVTDYKMPHMDGLELIASLRKREAGLPIVLISGFADTLGTERREHWRRRGDPEERQRGASPGPRRLPADAARSRFASPRASPPRGAQARARPAEAAAGELRRQEPFEGRPQGHQQRVQLIERRLDVADACGPRSSRRSTRSGTARRRAWLGRGRVRRVAIHAAAEDQPMTPIRPSSDILVQKSQL